MPFFKLSLVILLMKSFGISQIAFALSMIALIEPGVIAVMEPFRKAQKRFQTALSS